MTRALFRRSGGFTLIETIIAMVITGIVAGIVAVFIVLPIRAYLDAVRRADLSDAADGALRRMAFDIRRAVPNSVRVDPSGRFLEFVPASDGGRYRAATTNAGAGDPLDGSMPGDTSFDVLGPPVSGSAGDFVVVFNTGQVGLDVYAGDNRRGLSAAAGSSVTFVNAPASSFPPFDSPSQRFQIVPATGPLTYACENVSVVADSGDGTLRGYRNYGFQVIQSVGGLGAGELLADYISDCLFTYTPVSAANALVVLRLTMRRDGESVTLHHEIHVDNTP